MPPKPYRPAAPRPDARKNAPPAVDLRDPLRLGSLEGRCAIMCASGWSARRWRIGASAADGTCGTFFELTLRAGRIAPRPDMAPTDQPLTRDLPTANSQRAETQRDCLPWKLEVGSCRLGADPDSFSTLSGEGFKGLVIKPGGGLSWPDIRAYDADARWPGR